MLLRNIFLLLLAVLLAACDEPRLPSAFHASDVSLPLAKADFKLADHNGKQRTLADFRGKVVLLFFGYTHCPDVCPTTLADLGTGNPSLRRPSRWKTIASRISHSTSGIDAPVATQPGRSGTYAE